MKLKFFKRTALPFLLSTMIFSTPVIATENTNLSDLVGIYEQDIITNGFANSNTQNFYGTENDKATIENVYALGENSIIVTLNSYFPDFKISDLSLKGYNNDWINLNPKLNELSYDKYNISVNSEGKTVIIFKISKKINGTRLDSGLSEAPVISEDDKTKAISIADNELTWQLDCGGWDKDYKTHRERSWDGKESKITKGWTNAKGIPLGTIDNDGTYTEMADIAYAYALTNDEKYKVSFEKALDFIDDLQYESGGFAQVYPRRNNYSDYVTFNDDAMSSVLFMLEKIEEKQFPYNTGIISEKNYNKVCEMIESATDYILKAQITCNGKLSAWCAQHDPVTYEPRPARAYEKESISGSESIGVIKFLLTRQDNEKAISAAEAAIKWFDENKLENTAFDNKSTTDYDGDGNTDYFYEKKGKTTWYRFYECATGVGFFSDRDSGIYYDIADISAERREEYAWAGNWPEKIISTYKNYGYYPNQIVVSVSNTASKDINGKTLEKGVTMSPLANLADSFSGIQKGDVNADGILDINDVTLILQKALNYDVYLKIEKYGNNALFQYADLDGDNKITASDATLLLK